MAKYYDDDEEEEEVEEEEDEMDEIEPEEEEEEEEEEEDDRKGRKRKYKRSQFIDDVAEEDEDDDEEKEAPRKRRHRRGSEFIDDSAAVASDEDEEEDEGEEDFIHDEGADLQDEEEARRMHRRPPSLLDQDDQNEDVEDLERMIQQRYGRQEYEQYDESEATEVEQQALLPSIRDPKLWMIKCQLGHEREAAVCLMQKYLDLEGQDQPLLIKSAVALDQLKGYIYVESEKESSVRQAIRGMRMIFQSMVKLVPIKEMTDVLSVEKKSIDIDKENWVRVKSGIYKGDIGKVLDVDHVKQRATIKLVPRVDLQDVLAKLEGRDTGKKRMGFKPPQRFISIQEVKNMRIPVERKRENSRGDYYDQFANMRFSDGYLIKNVSLRSIHTREVVPSLDELQKFHKPGEDENADALGLPSTLSSRKKGHFMKGDAVVVVEGDLRNLMGIVEKVDEDNVEVLPKNIDLKGNVTFKVKQLTKFFKTGDHVKVISGKHEGATGMIVKVENIAVVILSDTTKEDIHVLKDSIVESSEVTSGLSKLGDYELHDLVLLDQTAVGVIVRVEPDGCQILKGTPEKQEVITVKQREMRKKIFDKNSSAQDREGNVVNLKDIVRVVEGPFKTKQGPVEHIHRGILFICDRHYLENGGFICIKARSCVAVGGARSGRDRLPVAPLVSSFGGLKSPSHYLQSPSRSTTNDHFLAPNGHGGRHGGRKRDDGLIGRTVKIRQGPFKGYRGRVKDATDSTVRIELESQMKVVTVRRDQLSDVGEVPANIRESPRDGNGNETPTHPSRTPMHSSYMMTPMRDPSATPIHDGMRTPMRDRAWNPYSAMTPLRDQSGDEAILGSWHSQAASPYQPGTPIAHRSYEAPTPGVGWANTPGGNYSEAGTPNDTTSNYGPPSPYIPGTPGGLPMTPAAPAYLPGTPGGQPMTPGIGVLDPSSPASGIGGHNAEAKWGLPDIVVSIRKPGGEPQTAVIKEVLQDGSCRVALGTSGEGEHLTVSQSEMELVLPKKNDRIKIVFGEMRGISGKLIGIDGGDGIVKTDDNFDVKILEMDWLGKLAV